MKFKLFVGQSQSNQVSMLYTAQSQANKIHRRLWVPVSCGFVIKMSTMIVKKDFI